MDLTYDISREDYWEFNKFYLTRSRHLRLRIGFTALIVASTCFLLLTLFEATPFKFAVVWACITGMLYVPFAYWNCKRTVMRIPSKGGTMLGEHHLKIGSDGVFGKSKAGEGLIRWSGVMDIIETKKYVFMFMDTTVAIIVPKRVFANSADMVQFLITATSFWKAAKP